MENQENLGLPEGNGGSKRAMIWLVFITVVSVIYFGVNLLLISFEVSAGLAMKICGLAWFLTLLITFIVGYVKTPHMYEDIVEVMGDYLGHPLHSGPHILFPYFGLEIIANRVYMGEQKLPLYLDEKDGNKGDVEFEDCSAPLRGYIFFKIFNSFRASYNIDDLIGAVEEKAEHKLRAFFGSYKLDEGISMKSFFNLANIVALIDLSDDTNVSFMDKLSPEEKEKVKSGKKIPPEIIKKLSATDEDVKKTKFYQDLDNWGARATSFTVTDIEVPDDIREQRARILAAEKDKQVAEIGMETADFEAKSTIITAKGEAEKIALIGEGEGKKVKSIITSTDLEPVAAADYLIQTAKWSAIGKNANVTLIEDSGRGATSDGYKIGVGMGTANKDGGNKNDNKKNEE